MLKSPSFFEYKWTNVGSVDDVSFVVGRGAEAVKLKLRDGDLIGLSSTDVERLSESFTNATSLKAVSLSDCGLDAVAAGTIMQGLRTAPLLESLDLSDNPIGDEGVEQVADFVTENKSLLHLDLSNCSFGSNGGGSLVDALEECKSLRSLVVDNNQELSSNSVSALFEIALRNKSVVNLSCLNNFCNIRFMSQLFSELKRNQRILSIGFPNFYHKKKNKRKNFGSSTCSLNEISKEDIVKLSSSTVRKPLLECLKSNVSLVKIYNFLPKSDVHLLLKRNLDLMKNEFNEILLNGKVDPMEVAEQKLVVLGRKGSGKSSVVSSLYGSQFVESSRYFELEIKTKFMFISKDDDINYNIKQVSRDVREQLSLKCAAKVLAEKSDKLRQNEKFQKLSRAYGSKLSKTRQQKRRGNRRNLQFFNIPDNGQEKRRSTSRSTSSSNENSVFRNYLNRTKRGNRYRFDSTSSNKSSESSTFSQSEFENTVPSAALSANMRKTEIVDNFDPKIIARYGNTNTPRRFLLAVREISNRITNNLAKGSGVNNSIGSNVRMTGISLSTAASGRKKLSDAEKYGDLNKSLVDLNHFVFGLKSGDGVFMLVFNLRKLLKYVQVDKAKMIVNNPITNFLKVNLKAIYNQSKDSHVVLVGTHYKDQMTKEKCSLEELSAINLMLKKELKHKFLKRLVRCKSQSKEYLSFFPVDSLENTNIEGLRSEIFKRLVKTSKKTTEMTRNVPIKYLRAQDVLLSWKKTAGNNFITKEELLKKVSEFGFKNVEELTGLLKYLRRKNEIIMFPQVELLKNFIVVNKSFLYFCMYQILNRRYLNKMFTKRDILADLRENDLSQDLKVFKSKKLISRRLIEFVWRSNNHFLFDKNIAVEDYYDNNVAGYLYVLEIMKKLLFVTEWRNLEINSGFPNEAPLVDNFFIVSSLLKMRNKRNLVSGNTKLIHNVKSFRDSIPGKPKSNTNTSLAKKLMKKSKEGTKMSRSQVVRGSYASKVTRKSNISSSSGSQTSENGDLRKQSKRLAFKGRRGPQSLHSNNSSRIRKEIAKLKLEKYQSKGHQKARYLLDKNKPVSVLLDFSDGFLPEGFFHRLCSTFYESCLEVMKTKSPKFASEVESIELYKNFFKLTFDRKVENVESVEDSEDDSTIGSVNDSEFESMSMMGAETRKLTKNVVKEENEYVLLYRTEKADSIVMVVREHENAPRFLKIFQNAVEDLEDNETGMMFFNFKAETKVEVKNNRFMLLDTAKRKNFAPWFAKNKLISPGKPNGRRSAAQVKSGFAEIAIEEDNSEKEREDSDFDLKFD